MNLTSDVSTAFQAVHSTGPFAWEANFFFSRDLPIFHGHFPGHPIVPGVYQLGCMLETFARGSGKLPEGLKIRTAKFVGLVEPPCDLVVRVAAEIRENQSLLRAQVIHKGQPTAIAVMDVSGFPK